MKPEIFERIVNQFGGKLPGSDEPIRSFLIRNEGFSASGADELIDTLRETLAALPVASETLSSTPQSNDTVVANPVPTAEKDEKSAEFLPPSPAIGELITLPLGQNCKAELRLIGDVTASSYGRLIKHLELLREIAAEEDGI